MSHQRGHGRGESSKGMTGTRKIAPADARSDFGPVGSAQPAESAIPAPNASAVRSSVPTLPGFADVPERKRERDRPTRQVVAPEDADHARRVAERRQVGDETGFDVLARDEQLDGLDPRRAGRVDEVFALAHEQPLSLALPSRLEQLADELQLRVVRRRDHSVHSSHAPWKSVCATSSRSPPG